MIVFRLIGWLLLIGAAVTLGADLLSYLDLDIWKSTPAGQVWFNLSPNSLNLSQAVVQRYLLPFLWDPMITWILLQPAFAVLGVPAIVFIFLGHKQKRRAKARRMFSRH